MASDIRKSWQDFKKKHPNFEKSKNFKSDVGPQLDKFDKARDEFTTLKYALIKKAAEVVTLGNSVNAALKGYEAVVKELSASDKTIKADFGKERFDAFAETYVVQYAKKIDL
jgi:hypothetical protein